MLEPKKWSTTQSLLVSMHALVDSLCEAWPHVIAFNLNKVFEYQSTTLSYMSTILQSNYHRLHHATCRKLISCNSSCLHGLNHQLVKLRRLGALVRLSNLTQEASQTIFWTSQRKAHFPRSTKTSVEGTHTDFRLSSKDGKGHEVSNSSWYLSEIFSQPSRLYHTGVGLQEDRCTSLPSFGLHWGRYDFHIVCSTLQNWQYSLRLVSSTWHLTLRGSVYYCWNQLYLVVCQHKCLGLYSSSTGRVSVDIRFSVETLRIPYPVCSSASPL